MPVVAVGSSAKRESPKSPDQLFRSRTKVQSGVKVTVFGVPAGFLAEETPDPGQPSLPPLASSCF